MWRQWRQPMRGERGGARGVGICGVIEEREIEVDRQKRSCIRLICYLREI
jgi:hypothetical protein